ncbi:beta-ketoacyl synthase N-terminal-like domain-containing protein [Actinosynnema sp. NPDC047251]|uniref:Putative polyketide synthase n=1 Tax=Saccharothrix espanaensis (strain ATCC 51144 / DSM 44229 / JCM 9112 / NBRC 15066 / NRRL 15764) TaxID=1179773 RepID=K0K695_SACES|nr:type I polyketide synthase [Saccharothrix espanaensis]CCH32068.1 putative polyketide synthase [Saccharothrix espanaensis DSM 44229]
MNDELDGVAIVGMSGRFPGAPDLDRFWSMLVAGEEGLSHYTADELLAAGVPRELVDDPSYTRSAHTLADFGLFDAEFFGLTRSEAEVTDPQQRLLLECSWEALERAGHPVPTGRTGVFAGVSQSTYLTERLADNGFAHPMQVRIGNDPGMAALRVSYKLNLSGPSLTVQTACSSSLVAVHLACQSLLTLECDLAVAGGAAVRLLGPRGHLHEEGGIHSTDGHCRPFDADATGTASGDGVAVVVLKRLADAVRDGDHVHAVILGSAVNNDGSDKIGFTAPSTTGQVAVLDEALAVAGVDRDTVQYVEAHGTATPLGDPIEARALAEVFGTRAEPGVLGSVKGNVGHLDAAAGVTGLIKVALALENGVIPPTAHFRRPNPELDALPFRVTAEPVPWPEAAHPRRAGVSSFGIGGTNAHVVVQAAPARRTEPTRRGLHVLPLSARTATALDEASRRLAGHLPAVDLADAAYTLQVGRAAFAHRRAVVADSAESAVEALGSPHRTEAGEPSVVFLLPGQGSQYTGMGEQLYRAEPVFRDALDECAELLRPHLGWDVREVAFRGADLRSTLRTQPTVFSVDYAVAKLLESWGVRPGAMIGHSLGELVAACLAGVFELPDALRVVATRAALMQDLPPGRMLAVPLDEAAATAALAGLAGPVTVAAVNAPGGCVVAGPENAVADARELLEAKGLIVKDVPTSHAFHTAMVDPALPELGRALRAAVLAKPRLPFASNVTGTWITDEQAVDPEYWVTHTRRPVRFADGLDAVLARGAAVLVEVGPGSVLSGLSRANPARPATAVTLRRGEPEGRTVLEALATVWEHGGEVDWAALHGDERRSRVPLPTYPFQRREHLVTPVVASPRREPSRWASAPVWLPSRAARGKLAPAKWLVLADGLGVAEALAAELPGEVTLVPPGGDLPDLRPDRVVHARSIRAESGADAATRYRTSQDDGFHGLLDLARGLGPDPVRIDVLTNDLQDVGPVLMPERATVLGAATVLAQEYGNVTCHSVDVTLPRSGEDLWRLVDQLLAELSAPQREEQVALRGDQRWARSYAPVALPDARAWQKGATYLVTGVDGELGRAFAEDMTRSGAKVVTAEPGRIADLARRHDIRGVVHAADVRGAGLIALKTREQAEQVLSAHVAAVLEIDEALPDVEFVLLCSSTTGVLGGFGQVENCASAAFLDAYAPARNRVVVDWAQWSWDDWLERQMADLPEVRERFRRQRLAEGITATEGVVLARAALAAGLNRLIVSTVDFSDSLAQRDELTASAFVAAVSGDTDADADWDPAQVWPDDEVARGVATIWRETLGVARIDPDDDFYELGGNSLFAIQIVSRLRQVHGDLPMSAIFEAPTVTGLASAIRSHQAEAIGLDEFDALLREIENLSPDEVAARLNGDSDV